MRIPTFLIISLITSLITAQSGTEIYVFDLKNNNQNYEISNGQNISLNDGYDNQPSFVDNEHLIYASTKDDQTDIKIQNVGVGYTKWLTKTDQGSEYSPLKIPNKEALSSIRLDKDGKQLLYEYDLETENVKPIFEDLVIGYHVWADKNTIVSFVLGDESSLVISNVKRKKHKTITKNIGRALFKIPNTKLVSYIDKTSSPWQIKSLNPKTGEAKTIVNTLENSEDMTWTPDGTILMGKGNELFQFTPQKDQEWKKIASLKNEYLNNITRMAVSPNGKKLAIVVDEDPVTIVQKQLDAYNQRNVEAFMDTYSDDIKIYNFPESLIVSGKQGMQLSYTTLFNNTPNLNATIKNRIVIGNKVIDEEHVIMGERKIEAVAIYEVANGKINKVTFVR